MSMGMKELFTQYGIDIMDQNVSRETFRRLDIYAALLAKWQKAINLVGPATVGDAARRHFLDSAQILRHIPNPASARLADMGSGAGFPGMVLAIMGVGDVHLIESDGRKAEFLRTVSRETNCPVTVHNCRVEECDIPGVTFVTARALAPLGELLDHMARLAPGATGLFLKGAKFEQEISAAREKRNFSLEIFPGIAEGEGRLLKVNLEMHETPEETPK